MRRGVIGCGNKSTNKLNTLLYILNFVSVVYAYSLCISDLSYHNIRKAITVLRNNGVSPRG